MRLDHVVDIKKPESDSQYRLVPCQCGSDQVVYLQIKSYAGQKVWVVRCMDCGKQTRPDTMVRHTAQRRWNEEVSNEQI